MLETRWTHAQREAIYGTAQKRLVAASAGTGKTAVLVERINTLLSMGAHIDRMLIVTFTNAAAAEMRERIGEALGSGGLPDELLRLPGAQISTLHAFCMDVLRRHFEAAGIDPAFRLCDETERAVLSARAMDAAMDELYEEAGEDFMALHECFGPHTALFEWAMAVYTHILARDDPWEWLERAVAMYDGSLLPWLPELAHMAGARLSGMRSRVEQLLAGQSLAEQSMGVYTETVKADLAVIEVYESALARDGITELAKTLADIDFPRMPSIRNADADEKARVSAVRDLIKKSRKALLDELRPLTLGAEGAEGDMRALHAPLEGLARLIRAYHLRFTELKAERNALDFSDMEHLALKAIKNKADVTSRFDHIFVDEYQDVSRVQEAILEAVCGESTLFLVGDVKQSIYRFRLADPTLFLEKFHSYAQPSDAALSDSAELPGSTVLPGASSLPGAAALSDAVDLSGAASLSGTVTRIDLTENFRSRENILKAVNAIFSGVMTSEAAEIDYDESSALVRGADFEGEDPAVQICVIDEKRWSAREGGTDESEEITNDSESGETGGEGEQYKDGENGGNDSKSGEAEPDLADLLAAEREAMACAQHINAIMAERLYDRKLKQYRSYTYSDIVILLRSVRGTAQLYADTLKSLGIPAYADVSTGFFDVPEVRVAVDILKTVHNRRQDIPLLSALCAVAGLDGPELAKIRLAHNEPKAAFYEAVLHCSRENDERGARLREFFSLLNEMRDRAASGTMEALMWHIYDATGWYGVVGAWPGGTARQGNLRALASYAEAFDSGQGGGLYEFIQYLEQLNDASSGAAASQSEQAVRIMSVHKSKGLEFPAVIVGGLGRAFNFRQKTYLLHDALGIAPPFIDAVAHTSRRTPAQTAVLWRQKREYIAEEMRILYVALTRARDRLVLLASVRDLERKLDLWRMPQAPVSVLFSGCFFDWIGPLFCEELSGGEELPEGEGLSGGEARETEKGGAIFNVRLMEPSAVPQVPQAVLGVEEALDFSTEPPNWVTKRLSWEYPHAKPPLPSKLSVTGLVRLGDFRPGDDLHPGDELEGDEVGEEHRGGGFHPEGEKERLIPELRPRPRFMSDEKPGPAEYGLAVHAVMQALDLSRLRGAKDLAKEISEQVNKQITAMPTLIPAVRDTVAQLTAFYASQLGQRLLGSPRIMREQPFNLAADKESLIDIIDIADGPSRVLVQGIIDCCFKDTVGWVLLDYKTDRRPNPVAEARHKKQVMLYARAVEEILGEPVAERYICYLRDNVQVSI